MGWDLTGPGWPLSQISLMPDMNYHTTSKQITFAHMLTNALYAIKETTIPVLSSMTIYTKFKGTVYDLTQPIATIHPPQNPTI